ncbi:MAG TPA: ABC transporter ATP-binding protein [Thermomicrobiales bacterium]
MRDYLVLDRLVKIYRPRGKPEVLAVQGISLSVAKGELLGLLGPSGCGKSSTLRMIAGLETVTSGDIRIAGQSVTGLPPHRRNVAVAFENYALYPPLTVEENIAFGLRARGERDVRRRVHEVAERLGITDLLPRKPGSLSSGQKQRVSLARAIVREPAVLLLDEPLSHLDASERERTRRELKRLQRETGYTTILVTHDQHEALTLADRIAVMNAGQIMQLGTPSEVYDAPQNLFVADFVGEPPMNIIPATVRTDGDAQRLQFSDSAALPLPEAAFGDGVEVVVGIRPQDIQVVSQTRPGTLPATVFAFEPLQELSRLTVAMPGVETRLVIQAPPTSSYSPGESVGLLVNYARLHIFDARTGERMPCPWMDAQPLTALSQSSSSATGSS